MSRPSREYAFDAKLWVVVRVHATSEDEARRMLKEKIDCIDLSSFSRIRFTEASLADEPALFEVDGEESP